MKSHQQRQPNRSTPFTTLIQIKNKAGQVIDTKEVVTAAGLIGLGHEDNLRSIQTTLLQAPSKENGQVAIVKVTVVTNKGSFDGIGDANPSNVNAKIAPHFIRMAETRAKARALRDAVNVGTLALEELGNADEEFVEEPSAFRPQPSRQGDQPRPTNDNVTATPAGGTGAPLAFMSDPQRRLLFRLATERGIPAENVKAWLEAELGVADLRGLSRGAASQAIDRLQKAAPNGNSTGAHAGVAS